MHMHTHIQFLYHLIFPVPPSILFKQIIRELMKFCLYLGLKLVIQTIKNLPAMWETQVLSLGWEDSLEEGVAIHSSILAWRISWTEPDMGYSPWGRKELDTTEHITHNTTIR